MEENKNTNTEATNGAPEWARNTPMGKTASNFADKQKKAFLAKNKQKEVKAESTEPVEPVKLDTKALSDEIKSGKYGNGEERKTNLRNAGYTDDEINAAQTSINTEAAKAADAEEAAQEVIQTPEAEATVDKATEISNRIDENGGNISPEEAKNNAAEIAPQLMDYAKGLGWEVTDDGSIRVPDNYWKTNKTLSALTFISGVLTLVTGGLLPPIDFSQLASEGMLGEKAMNAQLSIKAYNKLLNRFDLNFDLGMEEEGEARAAELASKEAENISREGSQKMAAWNAAKQGDTSLEQADISADLQTTLADKGYNLQKLVGSQALEQIEANADAQSILLVLAQKLQNKAQAEQFANYAEVVAQFDNDTMNKVAKGVKSMGGTTNFDNVCKFIDTAATGASKVAGSVVPF